MLYDAVQICDSINIFEIVGVIKMESNFIHGNGSFVLISSEIHKFLATSGKCCESYLGDSEWSVKIE